MAEGNRYGNVILCGYVDHLDPSMEKQFSALTCLLEDDVMLITYRGTDNTLVGWKEDFNMTFLDTIPSQKEAVQYLEAMAIAYPDRRIILCGHSKGGNLAVYAAAFCSFAIQNRIQRVYNHDGPGFFRRNAASSRLSLYCTAYRNLCSTIQRCRYADGA